MSEPEFIGSRREPLWDEFLIDTDQTTAPLRIHRPVAREIVLTHDAPWEGDGCNFHNILVDDGLYRMYYNAWEMLTPDATRHNNTNIRIAYAESTDGLTWTKPRLGLCEFDGSTDNNIILDQTVNRFDNFFVFKDCRPDCLRSEIYKGVGFSKADRYLWCFTSADGIRFAKSWPMTNKGKFDTLNIAYWDPHRSEYIGFIRNFHKPGGVDFQPGEKPVTGGGIRDIRWMTSPDFRTWTTPKLVDFGEADDVPLYTNVAQPYYRADHMFIGFPSRYIERKDCRANFERLPGRHRRNQRTAINPRFGLTVTDCVFMNSRDGRRWNRFDEMFIGPGPERDYNWVYGDGYPAVGMIETPSHLSDAPPELSMYAGENHWGQTPTDLRRYTLRIDGFASRYAPHEPKRLVTRPFVYEGDRLSINFATSAAGWVKLKLIGDGRTLESIEMFGDSLDRTVDFERGDVAEFAGKPVTMDIVMCETDLYSFKFGV